MMPDFTGAQADVCPAGLKYPRPATCFKAGLVSDAAFCMLLPIWDFASGGPSKLQA